MLVLRLLDQPADPAGAGAGDRPGGRRRDHRGGERQPPHGGRHEADRRRRSRRRASSAGPIIAMTVVLVAVYVPIGFQGGLTGALFTEFAFTLAGAVTVSAHRRADAVADDVRRRCCAARRGSWEAARFVALHRPRLRRRAPRLRAAAARQPGLPAGHPVFCADHARRHLLPATACDERAGAAGRPGRRHHVRSSAAAMRRSQQMAALSTGRCIETCQTIPEYDHVFQIDMPGTQDIAGMVLKPWDQRDANHRHVAAARAAEDGQASPARRSSRSSRRRCPAARACRSSSSSGTHRAVRAAERRGAEVPAGRAGERHVLLRRHRSARSTSRRPSSRSTATRPPCSASR